MVAREPRDLAAILKDNRQARRGDGFIVKGEKEVFLFSRPNEPYYNDTPYWVVPIPGEFINDHWDQWNGNFIGLMTALMSMAK